MSSLAPAAAPKDEFNYSFVLSPTKQFTYERRSIPELPSPRHVRVRIVATGLCGSDVHYWQHGRIGRYVVNSPIVLGHESAGIVEACGAEVRGLSTGDRVALEPGTGCNVCETCRSGRYNLCESMQFAATPPFDGTLSTYYTLPEECCFKLPAHISFKEGALVEPLSIAVHCCGLAGNLQGKTVLVFGAGPIGLLCGAVARAFGASNIIIADVVESRLDFARTYCANDTYKMGSGSPESQAEELKKMILEQGFDVVIDATGAQPCIECGVSALKRGGTFVQAGLGSPSIDFPIGQICDKEATLKGSFRYGPGDYKLAVSLLQANRIQLRPLITHEFEFDDAEKAFMNVAQKAGIKTIIFGPDINKVTAQGSGEGNVMPAISML